MRDGRSLKNETCRLRNAGDSYGCDVTVVLSPKTALRKSVSRS